MSIVTFWNDDKEQTGKTLTSVAVALRMAIERNLKILLISTGYKEETMANCFFAEKTTQNAFAGKNSGVAVENGIEGLSKLVSSNKIQANIITDYTKVIFKNRLEVLNGYNGSPEESEETNFRNYQKTSETYADLIKTANQYYDMVLVDIDNRLAEHIKKDILATSNLNVLVISQRLASLKKYNELKANNKEILGPKCIPVLGKYNTKSKYNKKNIMRVLEEKKEINVIPFNTLFFEAAEEAEVAELFLKLRDLKDTSDDNYFFMDEILKLTNNIIKRLQELQMKMR